VTNSANGQPDLSLTTGAIRVSPSMDTRAGDFHTLIEVQLDAARSAFDELRSATGQDCDEVLGRLASLAASFASSSEEAAAVVRLREQLRSAEGDITTAKEAAEAALAQAREALFVGADPAAAEAGFAKVAGEQVVLKNRVATLRTLVRQAADDFRRSLRAHLELHVDQLYTAAARTRREAEARIAAAVGADLRRLIVARDVMKILKPGAAAIKLRGVRDLVQDLIDAHDPAPDKPREGLEADSMQLCGCSAEEVRNPHRHGQGVPPQNMSRHAIGPVGTGSIAPG
jgi:hypothetical protein